MPRYYYRALNKEGKRITGEWIATNINDLEQRLFRSGLELINAKVTRRSTFLWQGTQHLRELMDFCFYLEQMLESDLPLLVGLNDMRNSIKSITLKNIIANMADTVESGKTLSEAMSLHANYFGAMFSILLAAGEKTGQMITIVKYLYEYIEWKIDFYDRIKKVITYPLISLFFIFFSFLSIFVFVIPEMKRFFLSLQIEMPLHTKLLIIFSDFISQHWIKLLLLGAFLAIIVTASYLESKKFKFYVNKCLLKIPFVGKFLMLLALLRFFKIMILSISAGINFLDAISLTVPTVNNDYIALNIANIRLCIERGESISEAFKKANVFESVVIQSLHVAEKTGEIEKALLQSSKFYDYQLKKQISLIETWLQPLLLSIVGGLLAWVMLSILGTIYQSLEHLPM
ncbi:MAG: type II secretion system F family protein [Pseudomonadota bacterium]